MKAKFHFNQAYSIIFGCEKRTFFFVVEATSIEIKKLLQDSSLQVLGVLLA